MRVWLAAPVFYWKLKGRLDSRCTVHASRPVWFGECRCWSERINFGGLEPDTQSASDIISCFTLQFFSFSLKSEQSKLNQCACACVHHGDLKKSALLFTCRGSGKEVEVTAGPTALKRNSLSLWCAVGAVDSWTHQSLASPSLPANVSILWLWVISGFGWVSSKKTSHDYTYVGQMKISLYGKFCYYFPFFFQISLGKSIQWKTHRS